MLVLSRQENEEIVLGSSSGQQLILPANEIIRVVVVDIRPGKVRIGIKAPTDFEVHRLEVWQAIQRDGFNKRTKDGGQ